MEKKFYLNYNFENFELIEKIKDHKNKGNQNYSNNINIKNVYPEYFENFKFEIMNSEFIPKIDNDNGDKLNLEDEEILSNISSNHSRYNQRLNILNDDLTNYAVGYHPPFRPFIYYYPNTNYTTNI